MATLRYYSRMAVAALSRRAKANLVWYAKPLPPAPETPDVDLTVLDSQIEFDPGTLAAALKIGQGTTENSDPSCSVKVYRALSQLRPLQAADGRLWAYLCHQEVPDYVAQRWPLNAAEGGGTQEEREVRHVLNHYFVSDSRSLIRSNALSRLWWMGYIADQVDSRDPWTFLEILTGRGRTDLRSEILERPSMSMNIHVLSGIYQVLRAEWDAHGGTDAGRLFQRSVYRAWLQGINRRGGVVLLDALSESALRDLLVEEADRVKG